MPILTHLAQDQNLWQRCGHILGDKNTRLTLALRHVLVPCKIGSNLRLIHCDHAESPLAFAVVILHLGLKLRVQESGSYGAEAISFYCHCETACFV